MMSTLIKNLCSHHLTIHACSSKKDEQLEQKVKVTLAIMLLKISLALLRSLFDKTQSSLATSKWLGNFIKRSGLLLCAKEGHFQWPVRSGVSFQRGGSEYNNTTRKRELPDISHAAHFGFLVASNESLFFFLLSLNMFAKINRTEQSILGSTCGSLSSDLDLPTSFVSEGFRCLSFLSKVSRDRSLREERPLKQQCLRTRNIMPCPHHQSENRHIYCCADADKKLSGDQTCRYLVDKQDWLWRIPQGLFCKILEKSFYSDFFSTKDSV